MNIEYAAVAKGIFHLVKWSYIKHIDEPFKYMMQINSQVQGMLNNIKSVRADHTKTINEIREQIHAELIYRIASFDVNFYNKYYLRKEFAEASKNFLKVVDKMIELAEGPRINITENSFLTVLENRAYFVEYGVGKPSFLQKVDELVEYYRREIDVTWKAVCRAKVNIDDI